jgi:hypothetical protein
MKFGAVSDIAAVGSVLFFPRAMFCTPQKRQSRHMYNFDGESKFNAQIAFLLA